MEEDLNANWPVFVVLSVVVAIPVAACVRVVHMLTVSSDSSAVVWLGLAPGLILSIASLTALGWASARRTMQPERAYVVGLLASAFAVLVTVESMAGFTTAVWHAGAIGAQTDATPSLWTSEQLYTWQLLSSLPGLELERGFGWTEPGVYLGALTGGAVIALKVLLVFPLARLLVSGYWWLRVRPLSDPMNDQEPWTYMAVLVGVGALTFGGVVAVWSPDSLLSRLLEDHLPEKVEIWQQTVPLGWVEGALQGVAVAWLLSVCALIATALLIMVGQEHDELLTLIGVFAGVLVLLPLGTVLTGVTTVLLVDHGLADSAPSLPRDAPIRAAVESQLWALADSIPALSIPDTMRWERPHLFTGWAVGLVSLGFKVFVVVVLFTLPWLATRLVGLFRREHGEQIVPVNLPGTSQWRSRLSRTV